MSQLSLFEIETIEPKKETNYPFLGEVWDSIKEFCNLLSVDYATRKYFHSLLKVGDIIVIDTSSDSKYYSLKKYHGKKAEIKSISDGCADVMFEGEEKVTWICTENVIEINGEKDSYKNYLGTINKMIKVESFMV